jgi:hypothetical protein
VPTRVAASLFSGTDSQSDLIPQPSFHYGAVSDKIGEAAACWLARWATDMLSYEQQSAVNRDPPTTPVQPLRDGLFENPSYTSNSKSRPITVIPVIWARGGLNARWVSALVGSDALFVKGERERYDFARSVIELRRKVGLVEEEEEEWEKMFSQGIYYTNMVRTVDNPEATVLICGLDQGGHFGYLARYITYNWPPICSPRNPASCTLEPISITS